MTATTKIEWTDATWPVVTGCSPVSDGCRNCYAARLAAGRLKHHPRYQGLTEIRSGRPVFNGTVRLNPDVLKQPMHWKRPRRVFVASMGDLFHPDVPDDFIVKTFAVMAASPQHKYQVLTKRPSRQREFIEWLGKSIKPLEAAAREMGHSFTFQGIPLLNWPLNNVWLGVSVEDQPSADERIPLLLDTPAAIRFVSYEPVLEAVDFSPWLPLCWDETCRGRLKYRGPDWVCRRCEMTDQNVCGNSLDWIIAGGESGPGARPFDLAWARDVIAQCWAAGVPVFVKQMGSNPFDPLADTGALVNNREPARPKFHGKGDDMAEWPNDLRVREMPEVG